MVKLDISTSFNEALSALDYNLIKGSGYYS